jgi:hypothetical protein
MQLCTNSVVTEKSKSVEVVFQLAQDQLLSLLNQQAELVARIATVKESLVALANLFGDHLLNNELIDRKVLSMIRPPRKRRTPGLTSATLQVLVESKKQLTCNEVRRLLRSRFPQCVEHHKSPTSSISTILKRLTISGELVESRDSHNLRIWVARNGEKSLEAHREKSLEAHVGS